MLARFMGQRVGVGRGTAGPEVGLHTVADGRTHIPSTPSLILCMFAEVHGRPFVFPAAGPMHVWTVLHVGGCSQEWRFSSTTASAENPSTLTLSALSAARQREGSSWADTRAVQGQY